MLYAVSLGTLFGVSLLHFFTAWPPTTPIFIAIFCLTLISVVILWKQIAIFVLAACVGWGWAYYQVLQKFSDKPQLEMQSPISLTGEVSGMVLSHSSHWQFDLKLSKKSPWKIRLSSSKALPRLREGDIVRLTAVLSEPWGMANPGGFDTQKQAWIENLLALGKIKKIEAMIPSDQCRLTKWRQRLSEKIEKDLKNQPLTGVIQAMTVGVRHRISREEWQVFQATGTSHVVAISGLHIGLAAAFFSKLIGWVVRRSYYLTCLAPVRSYESFAAILGAIFYSSAAGFAISTQRACIMIIVGMGARLCRKRIFSWQTLSISWLIIGFFDPFAPLQMGFWLSFGCVGALILGRTHYLSSSFWRRGIMPQWVVFIGLIPLSVLFFQQLPLISPIANFIFLPVVSFIIVPFSLLGTFGLPGGLWIAREALSLCWPILEYFSSLPDNVLTFHLPSTMTIAFSSTAIIFLLLPRGLPGRFLGWFGIFPLIWSKPHSIEEGIFRFTLLDVGQGLAAVIETKDHTLVYDTGSSKQIIYSFLKQLKKPLIDTIVISHTDLDHRGGLEGVLRFKWNEIYTSEPERLNTFSTACISQAKWTWNGVHFQFLNPVGEFKKRNNRSCVLKVSSQGQSVLLTGDIEALAERAMVEQFYDRLKSDIMVVPHHGSLTSSSQAFIEKVSPHYALFPVGKNNRYRFPKEAILRRYESKGIKTSLVWETGAIIFELGHPNPLTPPIYWRDTFNHYWNQYHGRRRKHD